MPKKTRPISELDAKMDPAVLERARKRAKEESLNIRLEYLDGLDMGLEITAYPKNSNEKEVLLRI